MNKMWIGVGAVIIVIVGLAAWSQYSTVTQPKEPIQLVKVSGEAVSKGAGTSPNFVTFEPTNGQKKSASIVDGRYETQLINGESYTVKLSYAGIIGGECTAGFLTLDENKPSIEYRVSC